MGHHIPKIEELMVTDPVVAFNDSNVIHVAGTLIKENLSCLPVMEKESGKFLGIISEKEVMEELVNDSLYDFFHETPLTSLMESDPVTLRPDMDMFEAEEIFRSRQLRHAPVLKDDKLVGIVSRKDLLEGAMNSIQDQKVSYQEMKKLENYEITSLTDYYKQINAR
jgi:CBS domain-containing protein